MCGTIVFVVTSGEYSDYRINAIFSTRAKAEQYLLLLTDSAEIEEYTLDSDEGKVRANVFCTRIALTTGDVLQQWDYDDLVPEHERGAPLEQPYEDACGTVLMVARSYVNAEHSLKLAAERRQEWLRALQSGHATPPFSVQHFRKP